MASPNDKYWIICSLLQPLVHIFAETHMLHSCYEQRNKYVYHYSADYHKHEHKETAGVAIAFHEHMYPYIKDIGIINSRIMVISLHGCNRD